MGESGRAPLNGRRRRAISMHRSAVLSALAIVVSAIGATGCSPSSPSSGGCQAKDVSFKTDVIPVFEQGCTITMECHGQMGNGQEENLYLGEHSGGTNADTVYMQIVGVKAKELPTMNLVTGGDLDNSFLWHKIHGASDLTALASQCMMAPRACVDCTSVTPCGSTMPYPGGTIDPGFACTIQNWIQNGAKNN